MVMTMRRLRYVPLCAACLGLWFGCAAPQTSGSAAIDPLTLSDWRPPLGQSCSVFSGSEELPAVEETVDLTLLAAELGPRWHQESPRAGHVLFTLAFDSAGVVREVRVLESSVPESLASETRDLVAAVLQPQPGSRRVRLRIDAGEPLRFRVGSVEMCRPELLNRGEITRVLSGAAAAAQGRRGRAILNIWIDESGNVVRTELAESSGDQMVDALSEGVARAMRFAPALNERVPVRVIIQIPVSISSR